MFIVKAVHRKLERKYLKLGWFHWMAVTHSLVSQDALASACRRWWGWTLGQHSTNLCKACSPWDERKDRRACLTSLKRTIWPVTVQFRHVNSWVCRVINNYRCLLCVYGAFTCQLWALPPLLCPQCPSGSHEAAAHLTKAASTQIH